MENRQYADCAPAGATIKKTVAIDIRPERSTASLQVVVTIKSLLKGARLQPCRKLICTAALWATGQA
jgi:hypothetical protein